MPVIHTNDKQALSSETVCVIWEHTAVLINGSVGISIGKIGNYAGIPRDTDSGKHNQPAGRSKQKPPHLVGPQKYSRLSIIPPAIASSQLPTFETPEGT